MKRYKIEFEIDGYEPNTHVLEHNHIVTSRKKAIEVLRELIDAWMRATDEYSDKESRRLADCTKILDIKIIM